MFRNKKYPYIFVTMLSKKNVLLKTIFLLFYCFCLGQNGALKITQDNKLDSIISLKKEVNKEDFTSGQYTIQVFSGNFNEGNELFEKLKNEKNEELFFSFETPYYKIRIGKYISKIDAIKKLKEIKINFPSAFILRPN